MRKELVAEMADIVGAVLFAAMAAGAFVLYLYATPDQSSAECERQRAEIKAEVAR